jgi:hypothetical protein
MKTLMPSVISAVCPLLHCIAALLFHSQDTTGSLERKSLHASCPVIRGTKWAASKWIRTGRYMTKSELLGMVQQLQRMQALLSTAGRIKQ